MKKKLMKLHINSNTLHNFSNVYILIGLFLILLLVGLSSFYLVSTTHFNFLIVSLGNLISLDILSKENLGNFIRLDSISKENLGNFINWDILYNINTKISGFFREYLNIISYKEILIVLGSILLKIILNLSLKYISMMLGLFMIYELYIFLINIKQNYDLICKFFEEIFHLNIFSDLSSQSPFASINIEDITPIIGYTFVFSFTFLFLYITVNLFKYTFKNLNINIIKLNTDNSSTKKKPSLHIDTKPKTGNEGLDAEKEWRENSSYCEHKEVFKYVADEKDNKDPMLCDFSNNFEETAGQSIKEQGDAPKKHPAVSKEGDWAYLCNDCHAVICKNCRVEYPSEENTPV
jgi:hypothetical protein